jgi:ribosomal protein S6
MTTSWALPNATAISSKAAAAKSSRSKIGGSKRLAYLVKKRDKGRYVLFDFVGLPAIISEMERQFKISEEVMKFLSVKLDDEVDLEAFKASREPAPEPEPPAVEAAASEASTEEAPEPAAVTEAAPTPDPVPAAETAPASDAAPAAEEVPTTEAAAEPEAPSTDTPAGETPEQAPVEAAADTAPSEESTPSEPVSEEKKEGE